MKKVSERDKVIVELLGELVEDTHYSDEYRQGIAYWLVKRMFTKVKTSE